VINEARPFISTHSLKYYSSHISSLCQENNKKEFQNKVDFSQKYYARSCIYDEACIGGDEQSNHEQPKGHSQDTIVPVT